MSYGRTPFYIWSDGAYVYFDDGPPANEYEIAPRVSQDQLAQFITHLAARGDDEINSWVKRGKELQAGDFTDDLSVHVTGGFVGQAPQSGSEVQAAVQAVVGRREDPLWMRRLHFIFAKLESAGLSKVKWPR